MRVCVNEGVWCQDYFLVWHCDPQRPRRRMSPLELWSCAGPEFRKWRRRILVYPLSLNFSLRFLLVIPPESRSLSALEAISSP
jgi:hypothetical protein